MDKKIFRSSVITALIVLAAGIVLIMGILFGIFETQIQNELKSEADYISYAVLAEGEEYIEHFRDSDRRITLISPSGEVLADTSADVSELENHSDRSEFAAAIENGSGTSIRYSDTLMQKTIYYAVRLTDGNVLRVSTTQYSAAAVLINLIRPILLIFFIAVILSFILSKRVSKAIVRPINELDLDNPSDNETYEELTPLLKKISAQKRTITSQLDEARRRQEEFRLITENMSEGFLVIDSRTNLLTYNRSALKLLDTDEVRDGSALMLNRTKGFREVIEDVLKGERAESGISVGEREYSLIANPVFEENKVIGAVIVILDVTERERREQLRREFTSNVSHELKTPLTSISGFAEIMKEGGVDESAVVDFSKSIYDEAQRLITLVNDIIKISEFDENSVQFEKEEIDLYETAANVISRLRPAAEKKSVTLNLIGKSTRLYAVKSIIEEMLFNLCDNAVKYNRENGTADVILSSTENEVSVTVRDTGIGIPFESQERVFERFYRVDKSHSKAIGGTGLGLSIVKHGAAYHNAEITLESAEGRGTSVTVTFKKEVIL